MCSRSGVATERNAQPLYTMVPTGCQTCLIMSLNTAALSSAIEHFTTPVQTKATSH